MKGFKDTPYQSDVFIVKQHGNNKFKIVYCKTIRESGWEDLNDQKKRCSVNETKLENSLSRSKRMVKEYAINNPWDFWCTFTINPTMYPNRHDLETYAKDLNEFIHNYNRRCDEEYRIKYLLVPEQHKDGAWHMHGFIKGIKPKDLFINEHGYLSWKQYNKKFGFISMDRIHDLDKASSYILKYMTKDTDKNVSELNKHMYYCSKGLKTDTEIYRGNAFFHGTWDWEHEDGYCKIKEIDTRKEDLHDYLEIY